MTDTSLLAPFDADVIQAVANANDVDPDPLREALTAHQRTMRENPGVEDVVYEWRKQYDDPVLARTDSEYVLGLPPTVWEEYGEYLDLDEPILRAVTAVHQEQTLRTEDISLAGLTDGYTILIVGRI
jgi:hypothetical protein